MIETTPIFDRVAATVAHELAGPGTRCRWCSKTQRARIHRAATREPQPCT